MIFTAKFFLNQNIYSSNEAKDSTLTLDLTEVCLVEFVWKGEIVRLKEAHDKVRVGQTSIFLDWLVQELKGSDKALGGRILVKRNWLAFEKFSFQVLLKLIKFEGLIWTHLNQLLL